MDRTPRLSNLMISLTIPTVQSKLSQNLAKGQAYKNDWSYRAKSPKIAKNCFFTKSRGYGGSGVFLNVKIKQNLDLNSSMDTFWKFKDPLFFIFAQNAIAPAIFGSQSQISYFGVISFPKTAIICQNWIKRDSGEN